MDLIVHTAGGTVQSVSGVNESTSCAQIVFALAHATHQKGRFSLVAKTNGPAPREYHFAPNERPYEFFQESQQRGIGVDFELRRLDELENSASIEDEFDGEVIHTPNGISANSSSTTLNDFFNSTGQHTRHDFSFDCAVNRPPPPDYNAVMTERSNSLRRGATINKKTPSPLTFLNIPNFSLQELYSRNFSNSDLEALVEIQEKMLTAQKGELVRVELTLLNSNERELVQLRKQYNNLQTVLNSLRNATWPERIEAESAEAERLHTAIAAMRTALAEKKRELYEAVQLQLTLERQLADELNRLEVGNEEREL